MYNTLKRKYDELSRPTGLEQIRNKRRTEKNKEENACNGHNVADQILVVENMVSQNHPFVRTIIRDKNKTPCIILYTDEQIEDLKNICCNGDAVLGVDKTFNLCKMHVTITCYKQTSVIRHDTNEHPIFLGPIFIHDNSDFESFGNFFFHLKMKLISKDLSPLIIGTDDEKAMVKAIVNVFPESTHVLCSRHLKQNVLHKLTDDAVSKEDRNVIVNKIFGTNGISDADDTICFQSKCDDFEEYCSEKSDKFLKYFQDRLRNDIRDKLNLPVRQNKITSDWTNNNAESMIHILKQTTDWKKKPLPELISSLENDVVCQFKELRSALIGTGELRLAETHEQFRISKTELCKKNEKQRLRAYQRFRKYVHTEKKYVTSSDGRCVVVAPRTLGKKPMQKTRRPKTVSRPKGKKGSKDEDN